MRVIGVFLTLVVWSGTALAEEPDREQLGTFHGEHQTEWSVVGTAKRIGLSLRHTVTVSKFRDLLTVEAGPEKTAQSFFVTKDTAKDGVRTIEFRRPKEGTQLAADNLKGMMRGMKAAAGRGRLVLAGQGMLLRQVGRGQIQAGGDVHDIAWRNKFGGLSVGPRAGRAAPKGGR